MKKRLFEFTCPHCGHSFFLPRDTYLIRDETSPEYRRLKDGTYFMRQCQNCMRLFELDYPLIWRDPRQGLSLICTDGPADGFEGKVVLTRSSRQFLEAFSILDLQLPLRETLSFKRALEREKGAALRVVDYDQSNDILWLDLQGKPLGIECFLRKSNAGKVK